MKNTYRDVIVHPYKQESEKFVSKYSFWNEYNNADIVSDGDYQGILFNHLCADKNVNLINKYKKLSAINDKDFQWLISPCTDRMNNKSKYVIYREKFELAIQESLKMKNDLLYPFYMLCMEIMIEKNCEKYYDIFCINLKEPLTALLFKSIQLMKRFFETDLGKDEAFEPWMIENGYMLLFDEYPILFRLVCDLIYSSVCNLKECLTRIEEDSVVIRKRLNVNTKQKILRISSSVSDRHKDGRAVIIIQYEKGDKLVYKPRNMEIDRFWKEILLLISEKNKLLKLECAETISMKEYGYAEYVEYRPVMSEEDIKKYYYKCGVTLALISLLGGSDFHHENIIVSKGMPILVDLETLITPWAKREYATTESDPLTENMISLNIARTLLLTKWVGKSTDTAINIGAFTSANQNKKNYPIHLDGTPAYADRYIEEVIQGYQNCLLEICNNKDKIKRLINKVKTLSTRYVLRNTRIYYQLLNYFSNPIFLKNGSIYECATMRIYAPYLLACSDEVCKKIWSMIVEEQKAIKNLNIPIFMTKGDSTSLYDGYGNSLVEDFFQSTPYEIVLQNIERCSQEYLKSYTNFILKTLTLSRMQREQNYKLDWSYDDCQRIFEKNTVLETKKIEDEISKIYIEIISHILDKDKFIFVAPVKDRFTCRYEMTILDNSLYGGNLGVYIFLAMYYEYFNNDEEQKRLKIHIKKFLYNFISDASYLKFNDISFCQGVAGIIFFINKYSRIIDTTEFQEVILSVLEQLTLDKRNIKETDYFNGICGLLYSICDWTRNSDGEIPLFVKELIKDIVEMIMAACDGKYNLWFDSESDYKPLLGLAHGQSGYILALASALEFLEDNQKSRVKNIIKHAIEYENSQYCECDRNVPDYRRFKVNIRNTNPTKYVKRYMHGNCAGIIGCVLAYLRINDYIQIEMLEVWIERALKYLEKVEFVGNDSLCCGTSAWVDLLVEISKYPQYKEWCEKQIMRIINTRIKEGYVFNAFKEIRDISLFKGMAGVGYSLLRSIKDYPNIVC